MRNAILILGIVLLFAMSASAQAPQPFSIYGGGAVSMPTSPEGFDAGWKMGWHGWAGFGYKFMPKMQVVGKFEYHTFGSDLGLVGLEGGNANFTLFGADARWTFDVPNSPIKPFCFGGAGMAHLAWSEYTGALAAALGDPQIPAQDKMYWNFGAGCDIKGGPVWSFFVQAKYVSVATDGSAMAFIPVSLGVKFF